MEIDLLNDTMHVPFYGSLIEEIRCTFGYWLEPPLIMQLVQDDEIISQASAPTCNPIVEQTISYSLL